jgi:chaperonin GroES
MATIPEFNFGFELEGDRIAIKRAESETKTKGGIIIPDTAKEKPFKGILIQMGDDIWRNEQGMKKSGCPYFIGQPMQFGKYAGSEVEGEDGEEYLIMREHDILMYKRLDQFQSMTQEQYSKYL